MTRKLDDSARKFDATPFEKRYVLYGLNMAVQHIVAQKSVFITEGVFDMLMMWQYGIRNTVTANGCGMTTEQIHLCSRFTDTFYIIYDPDKAGIKGSRSVLDTLKKYELKGRNIPLNSKVDLDEYLLSNGTKEIMRYVQNSA
jgi:DNA primase